VAVLGNDEVFHEVSSGRNSSKGTRSRVATDTDGMMSMRSLLEALVHVCPTEGRMITRCPPRVT
jgi:hypothetical protein